jgi:Asp-tRNA(Asn)/Glu-tRNA(Gln) amidotransferase B subunit
VVARWIVNDLPAVLGDRDLAATALSGPALASLAAAVVAGEVTAQAARDVIGELVERGGDPRAIIAERGLARVSDEDALVPLVEGVLDGNPEKVHEYRAGKTALFGFFMGQVVRASRGNADPQVVKRLLAERLG